MRCLRKRKRSPQPLRLRSVLCLLSTCCHGKDESLFCNGDCQQLLHRYCAGVSLSCYKEIKGKGDSFYCYGCSERRNKRDLAVLKHTVELLKQEIAELKKTLSQVQSESANVPRQDCGTHSQPSYASITGSGEPVTDTGPKPQVVTTKERYHLGRKFICGIKECQK